MQKKKIYHQIQKNTLWLMLFQLAKMIFPFLTLPILTRRLLVSTYGDITFIKTTMNFMQIFIDFGFMISATKEIASHPQNPKKISQILADTIFSRLILAFLGIFVLLFLAIFVPILKQNLLFTFLSYITVVLSIFLFDFLFRGLEIIHIMTIRFVLMKTISTILTILLVHQDQDILLIPTLEIISSIIVIILVLIEVKKLGIFVLPPTLKTALSSLKTSFTYFLSDIASTAFNALSIIIIGLVLSSSQVALFGLAIQIIGSIQALFGQLANAIYPIMVRNKNLHLVKKIFKTTLPLVLVFTFSFAFLSPLGLQIFGGEKYLAAKEIIQILSITIFFSYLNIILGWPTLGVINKQNAVTFSTTLSTLFNLLTLLLLLYLGKLTLFSVAVVRVFTELVLFVIRLYLFKKYQSKFYI